MANKVQFTVQGQDVADLRNKANAVIARLTGGKDATSVRGGVITPVDWITEGGSNPVVSSWEQGWTCYVEG